LGFFSLIGFPECVCVKCVMIAVMLITHLNMDSSLALYTILGRQFDISIQPKTALFKPSVAQLIKLAGHRFSFKYQAYFMLFNFKALLKSHKTFLGTSEPRIR
jgi:hypothetical protein